VLCAAIRWLGFRDCDFGADEGLRILTHYLGKLKLQVLALEQCLLTDASLPYVTSILRVGAFAIFYCSICCCISYFCVPL
jgi:hypothetical protein